ncbi:MAG TPA: sigma-54 dependent transcriptional regulator [Chloroflexota bacterium]|nr:sigma-54 dependent transcriptional regulator [Chloroflexota bacterium]
MPASAAAKKRIIAADDDPAIVGMLEQFLKSEGYVFEPATSADDALNKVRKSQPDLLLLDVNMPPGATGIEVIKKLKEEKLDVPTIVFTAAGTSQMAIEAIQLGAYDYIAKPFDLDELSVTIKNLFAHRALLDEVHELRDVVANADGMIGRHPKMLQVFTTIGRIARSDATVLILGETGSGKTMLAEQIHRSSNRRGGPYVTVACATLPETLLESELFGHEKGAFTSAIAQRKGRFEMAHKGTIFLDEIGEMTLATQRKLLRVLQDKEFERVGGSIPIRVDVRIVAATNKWLPDEVAKGNFREDLYYRLNVVTIDMPALRERHHADPGLDDVRNLTLRFLDKHRYNNSLTPNRISEEALEKIMAHDFPGNVRELENLVERAVIMSQGDIITPDHIVFSHSPVMGSAASAIDVEASVRRGQHLPDLLSSVERRAIQFAFKETGNRSAAAQMLGIPEADLLKRAKALDVEL